MSPEQQELREIFSEALAKTSPEERERYLAAACGQDAELRHQMDSLLGAHIQAAGFLKQNILLRDSPGMSEGPGSVIGRYKLRERIGEGGCGVVYVADQEEPVRRQVALKVIKLGMDTRSVVARFEAERQALAMMDHPNIAKVLDAGATETGRPYFVMELVCGLRITDYCDQNKLTTGERLDLFIKTCQAVQHAHQKGIIHRDLKPSNILVALHDGVPVPKVIDFGIAKATEGRLTDRTVYTELHNFIGTPAYMSPEQAEMSGRDIDTRSDIYSLGVLLYELLTGCTPFDAKELLACGLEAMRRTIREQDPLRPSTRLHGLSGQALTATAQRRAIEAPKLIRLVRGDLDWIVMKCLDKDRTRRYETANGLAADLQRHLNNDPIVARPPTSIYRLQKFSRRNKGAVAVAATVSALLLAGIAVSTSLTFRATRAERAQTRLRKEAERVGQLAQDKASAEAREHQRAEQALSRIQQQRVQELFAADDTPQALALLVKMLRLNPSNQVAADRLLSAMSQRSFLLPTVKTLDVKERAAALKYSNDGRFITTRDTNFSLHICCASTGAAIATPAMPFKGTPVYEGLTSEGFLSLVAERHQRGEFFPILRGRLYVMLVSGIENEVRETNLTSTIQLSAAKSALLFADPSKIVTTSAENVVSLWDTRSGQLLASTPRLDSEIRNGFLLSAGRRAVLVTGGMFIFWDPKENTVRSQAIEHFDQFDHVAVSADERWILGCGYPGGIALWDANTGELNGIIRNWDLHWSDKPFFGEDGKYLVTPGVGGTVCVWDAATCIPVTPTLFHFDATIKVQATAALSPDGQWLATVVPDEDKTVRVWDVTRGKMLNSPIHEDCDDVAFAPDGKELFTLSQHHPSRFWRLRRADCAWLPRWNPDALSYPRPDQKRNRLLGVAQTAGSIPALIDLRTGQVQARASLPLTNVTTAAICPGAHCFLTVHTDGTLRTWDAASGTLLRVLSGANAYPRVTRYSPNHDALLIFGDRALGEERNVLIWNLTSETTQPLLLQHAEKVYDAGFSGDGQRIATACRDGTVHLWNSRSGTEVAAPLRHESRVTSVQFSPSGRELLTTSEGQAHLWNLDSAREMFTPRKHEYQFVEGHMDEYLKMSAKFSPDGRRIATASGFTAQVWDTSSGAAVLEPMKHPTWVLDAEFNADGSRLVTTCADRGVRVWDANTGALLSEPMRVHSRYDFSFSAQFTPDGDWIAATTPGNAGGLEWTVWETPKAVCPVPAALLELAEALGGQRMDEMGMTQSLPWQKVLDLQQQFAGSPERREYDRWARWFFDDDSSRKITPHSDQSCLEYVQERIQSGSQEDLEEALRVSPTNAVAMMRLAQFLSREQARFWAKRGLQFAHGAAEITSACMEVLKNLPGVTE